MRNLLVTNHVISARRSIASLSSRIDSHLIRWIVPRLLNDNPPFESPAGQIGSRLLWVVGRTRRISEYDHQFGSDIPGCQYTVPGD